MERLNNGEEDFMLILAKILPLAWVAFFAGISFIAVKRLDKPSLSENERNRLKFYVILLTCFSAVYGHIQGQEIERQIEKAAAAIPGIQTDLKKIEGKINDLPNIKEWMAFRLREEKASSGGKESKQPAWELVTGSIREENRDLPEEDIVLKEVEAKDPSDINRINLAHGYIVSKRYTLARQMFEFVIQTSHDYLNTEIAALMARALRTGLGDKLARKEIGLAWVVQWDEEPHYKLTVFLSDDRVNWVAIPLEPSNPAGTVVKYSLKQFIRIAAEPSAGTAGKAVLYQHSIMLSMGIVDKDYKLVHPLLLSKPQHIPW